MSILLLGGEGFLGQGLLKELIYRNINFKSLDINNIDLSNIKNTPTLINVLKDFDNIVILASKIGAKLFNTDPINAAFYNLNISNNIINAICCASKKYNKSFSVTYYSTSEVYGSKQHINDLITENTTYQFNTNTNRYLYAYIKSLTEDYLYEIKNNCPNIINSVKILRPFNIYGKNQKRGVVYDMIYSALTKNIILYSDDTTRTLTDIDFASKQSAVAILQHNDIKLNVVDSRTSLTMEVLAHIINDILGLKCNIIKLPTDNVIQYRTVSLVNLNIEQSKKIMKKHIIKLAEQILK